MTNKIQKSMLTLVLISITIFGLGTSFLFYNTEKNKAIEIVLNQIAILKTSYNKQVISDENVVLDEIITQSRITLINEKGEVVFDNKSPLDTLDNHNDRLEIIEAKVKGFGEKERYSESFLKMFYYYAILLEDGYILRISTEISSFYSIVLMMLPFMLFSILLIFIIALLISKRLSKKIVEPIEKADLKSTLISPYLELDQYFNTMREQKSEINHQLQRVNKRSETINKILNTMQEGFLIVGNNLNIYLANKAFLKIVNSNNYQQGDSIYNFVTDSELINKIKASLNQQNSIYQLQVDNKIYQVYFNNSKILKEDVAIILFVDITLEFKNQRYRQQFSANVSHELKTPLTSIKGLAELQANDLIKNADVIKFGEKIYRQSERLLALIDNIIKISKFDEEAIKEDFNQVNIKKVIFAVLNNLKAEINAKEIEVITNISETFFLANYQMIDELIYNLVDNAIKYNQLKGFIEINVNEFDSNLKISIINSGQKIPKKDIKHIFDRFYRIDSSRDKKTGGSGLGLSIVKHIVLYHKGSISVNSDLNTVFIVILPKM